jgi:hypothetical protein
LTCCISNLTLRLDPFSFSGTVPFLDSSDLQAAFSNPPYSLSIPFARKDGLSASLANSGGMPGLVPSSKSSSDTIVPLSKMGVLWRKDDILESGKKSSNRKWREMSVFLTGGQLLFFKDHTWAPDLLAKAEEKPHLGDQHESSPLAVPDGRIFKPDQTLSLAHHVALYDFSYIKRANVFALVGAEGSQTFFQANDATEMNEWIALINYAAAFKTSGIFMRSPTTAPDRPAFPRSSSSDRTPHSSISALPNQSNSPSIARKTIYSAQGHVVGSQDIPVDPLWEDEAIFEQFSHATYHVSAGQRHISRSHILMLKISELDQDILTQKAELRQALQTARCLALCRPLVATTRDRIMASAQPLAAQVRKLRLDLCRKVATREVLARDLLTAEREATRMRAATGQESRSRLKSTASEVHLPELLLETASQDGVGSSPMRRRHTEDAGLNLMVGSAPRGRTISSPSTPGCSRGDMLYFGKD